MKVHHIDTSLELFRIIKLMLLVITLKSEDIQILFLQIMLKLLPLQIHQTGIWIPDI